MIPIKV